MTLYRIFTEYGRSTHYKLRMLISAFIKGDFIITYSTHYTFEGGLQQVSIIEVMSSDPQTKFKVLELVDSLKDKAKTTVMALPVLWSK